MKKALITNLLGLGFLIGVFLSCTSNTEDNTGSVNRLNGNEIKSDPLPSWNEGKNKADIISFVNAVTDENGMDFIPVKERIAVFDNDGTMWSEQPMYFQFFFAVDRLKELAPDHPGWKNEEPFKSILEKRPEALLGSGKEGIGKVLLATHTGMTVSEFHLIVTRWIKTARHPVDNKPYTDFIYKPMLELLQYLKANGFKNYIVSGGSLEFMRPIICDIYGIPDEQILGTTFKSKYEYNNGNPAINRLAEMSFYNDKGNKVVNIQKSIGKKPVFCGGNSDGDLAMMQWTASNNYKTLKLYIHHTDSIREWAYGRHSKIGHLDKGLDQARQDGWNVVDMKNDWKMIFINN